MGLAALSLLPPRWLQPWTSDVAAVVWFPLRPIEHGLSAIGRAMRAPAERDPSLDERSRELSNERDELRGLLYAERLRSADLEDRVRQLEATARFDQARGSRPLSATVVARAGPATGVLTLNVGSGHGVRAGDPAVVRGDLLVGRVAADLTATQSFLVPIDHPGIGRLDAVVIVQGAESMKAAQLPVIQVRPDGKGSLIGEVTTSAGVAEGDVVRLNDPTWKAAAQGMRLGTVRSVKALDSNPLRRRVEVVPDVEPGRVGNVTLKCEAEAAP